MDKVKLPTHTPQYRAAMPEVKGPIVAYPGYNALREQEHWDEATRAVILHRVHDVPPIRFFDASEVRLLQAVVDRIMPQDDRPLDERIPIVPWIDNRCYLKIIDGIRYAGMPPDEVAWRRGLRGIDEVARARFDREFVDLSAEQQDDVLRCIGEGHPPGETWQNLPARRFWDVILMPQIAAVYYAHPTAWDEIGYGGPAYPRGYLALNNGEREPWEVKEVRLHATPNQS